MARQVMVREYRVPTERAGKPLESSQIFSRDSKNEAAAQRSSTQESQRNVESDS